MQIMRLNNTNKVQLNTPYGKYFSTSVNFANARVYLLDFNG